MFLGIEARLARLIHSQPPAPGTSQASEGEKLESQMAADIKAKNWIDRFDWTGCYRNAGDSQRSLSQLQRKPRKNRADHVSNPAVPKCHFERLPSVVNTTIERTIRLLLESYLSSQSHCRPLCKRKSHRHISGCRIPVADCLRPTVAKPAQQHGIGNQLGGVPILITISPAKQGCDFIAISGHPWCPWCPRLWWVWIRSQHACHL